MRSNLMLGIGFLCLLTLGSCFGYDDDVEEPTEVEESTLDPQEVLDRGAEQWNETESARFELEIDGETYLDEAESIQLIGAEGALVAPSSAQADAEISAGPLSSDVSLIIIDGDVYMTDLLTGSWGEAPGDFDYDPSILLSEEEGLGAIMQEIENAEATRDNGEIAVSGEAPEESVENVTAGAVTGEDGVVDVSLTFDSETDNLLNISVEGTDDDSWHISIFDHNESITIERPNG